MNRGQERGKLGRGLSPDTPKSRDRPAAVGEDFSSLDQRMFSLHLCPSRGWDGMG